MSEITTYGKAIKSSPPTLEITDYGSPKRAVQKWQYEDAEIVDAHNTDIVPFEDKAMAGVVTAVHWTVGTALPFVVEGSFYVMGVTIQAVFRGLFRAFFARKRKSKLDFPPAMGRTGRAASFNNFSGNVTINGDVTINNYF